MTQTQIVSLPFWTRLSVLAAVGVTAAAVGIACSSSSSAAPPTGDDAAAPPPMPCDASIVLPTGSSKGGPCGDCLAAHCMDVLSTCQMESCGCVSGLECVAANYDDYTKCTDALSLLASGSPGLMALGKCIVDSCPVCNDPPD